MKKSHHIKKGLFLNYNKDPTKTSFQEPKDLESLVNTSKLIQKFLLKQADIDKILEIIRQKVLKGVHLSVTIKEIQAGYLNSLYFKDIYLYLTHKQTSPSTIRFLII